MFYFFNAGFGDGLVIMIQGDFVLTESPFFMIPFGCVVRSPVRLLLFIICADLKMSLRMSAERGLLDGMAF